VQPEISSKVRWKKHTILDENIPYLGGGREGGGSESLNQKNLPHVVFAFPVPPCSQHQCMWMHCMSRMQDTCPPQKYWPPKPDNTSYGIKNLL